MVIEPAIQPIKESTVSNHGIPIIRVWPPRQVLGYNMTKSTIYSHELTKINRSSITPSGLIVERSTNYKTIGVGQTCVLICRNCVISIGVMLIAAPKSTNTWGRNVCPILTMTVGFPGSPHLIGGVLPSISLDNYPTMCTVRGSLGFLPGF
jgi:hypothetical protein